MFIFTPQIFNIVLEVVANIISYEKKNKFKNRKEEIKLLFANDRSGYLESPKKQPINYYKK